MFVQHPCSHKNHRGVFVFPVNFKLSSSRGRNWTRNDRTANIPETWNKEIKQSFFFPLIFQSPQKGIQFFDPRSTLLLAEDTPSWNLYAFSIQESDKNRPPKGNAFSTRSVLWEEKGGGGDWSCSSGRASLFSPLSLSLSISPAGEHRTMATLGPWFVVPGSAFGDCFDGFCLCFCFTVLYPSRVLFRRRATTSKRNKRIVLEDNTYIFSD